MDFSCTPSLFLTVNLTKNVRKNIKRNLKNLKEQLIIITYGPFTASFEKNSIKKPEKKNIKAKMLYHEARSPKL